jgi:hypothetical protein
MGPRTAPIIHNLLSGIETEGIGVIPEVSPKILLIV